MTEGSIMVPLPQLVELAVNSPEMGVINFNMLHALLHVLVQQSDLATATVEFRGNNSERVQNMMKSMKPSQTINVSEFAISKEGKPKEVAKTKTADTETERVILVETVSEAISTPHISMAYSKGHLKQIEDEVEELWKKIKELEELPSNLGLFVAIKDKNQPIVDMFQILTLNKRILAAEEGIKKMGSMIEDLARNSDMAVPKPVVNNVIVPPKPVDLGRTSTADSSQLTERFAYLEAVIGVESAAPDQKPVMIELGTLKQQVSDLKQEVEEHRNIMTGVFMPPADNSGKGSQSASDSAGGGQSKGSGGAAEASSSGHPEQSDAGSKSTKEDEHKSHTESEGAVSKPRNAPPRHRSINKDGSKSATKTVSRKISVKAPEEESENYPRIMTSALAFAQRFDENQQCVKDQIDTLNTSLQNEIAVTRRQLSDLEQVVNSIIDKLKVGSDTESQSEISTNQVMNRMSQLQVEMESLVETANKLIIDKEERETRMNMLHEEIELLKTIKADREDLEDALADKADACAVNRKVSHDQFDAACDELSKAIEETLSKLTQQESLWQQALTDIQKEISNKLDKAELLPLRDFINNKLKMLQDKLKDLSKLKKETEAAGVKSKYLKDVNCISCDKNVVMRKQLDSATMPKPYAMPPNKSMAPYLAYELDNLRKQQKCFPHGRDLHHFEKAMGGPKIAEDHICNRYCGGSHTITTPQQRVTRLGHFVQQWGLDVLPMAEGVIRGTDGQMYKSNEPDGQAKPRSSLVVQGEIVPPRKLSKGGDGVDAAGAEPKDKRPGKSIEKVPSAKAAPERQPSKTSKGSQKSEGKAQPPSRKGSATSGGSKKGTRASLTEGEEQQEQEIKSGSVTPAEGAPGEEQPQDQSGAESGGEGEQQPLDVIEEVPHEEASEPENAEEQQ